MSGAERRVGRRPMPGVLVAGLTAVVSGVSVFVNGYGVRAGASPALYTTAKNLVAFVVLGLVAAAGLVRRRRRESGPATRFVTVTASGANPGESRGRSAPPRGRWISRLGLAYVAVVGGGLAFVLFFNGLAQSEPAPAAFWRDTLVVWVALLAGLVLRERVRWWNVTAIVLVVAGEIVVTGGVGRLGAERGEWDVLASSVLWALEVVVARRLLVERSPATLALVRMGGGGATLIAYLAASGALSGLWSMTADQVHWALWTGLLLGAYVATWMTALARARALDVTSVLAASALLTWLLQWLAGTVTPATSALGFVLIVAGAVLVAVAAARGGRARRAVAVGP